MTAPLFDLRLILTSPVFEAAAFVLGLVVGSFANVCIHRLPLGLSVVDPPSRCPRCEARIAPYDNVPLFGWLWLRGRCRSCRAPISPRYPAVELLNGLLYLGFALLFGPSLETGVKMALATTLLVLAVIDLDHQILPDAITLPALAAGLGVGLLAVPAPVYLLWLAGAGGFAAMALAGMVLGFDRRRSDDEGGPDWKLVAVLLAFAAWHRFTLGVFAWPALVAAAAYVVTAGVAVAAARYYKREALGQGDWKLVAMLGAFLEAQGTMLAVFLGALTGAVTGLLLMALGRASRLTQLPLGTFLSLGGLVVLFVGEPLLAWYKGLYQ